MADELSKRILQRLQPPDAVTEAERKAFLDRYGVTGDGAVLVWADSSNTPEPPPGEFTRLFPDALLIQVVNEDYLP